MKDALEAEISKVKRRIDRLNSRRGRENMLYMARTIHDNPFVVDPEKWDAEPWLMATQNCVVELRTGAGRPGRREDLLTKQVAYAFNDIDEEAPLWEQTLSEIFNDDPALIQYLQRLFGCGLVGSVVEHVLPIFWGKGRNGKTTIVETISHILGPLAGPVPSELLLYQGRYRSAAGPSPDIMALRGLRLAFAAETDENRYISVSRVKWLTGSDTLTGRNAYDRGLLKFQPSHLLILCTNNVPGAPSDDFAFWQRVHLVPFRLSFVDREPVNEHERRADKALVEKLKQEGSGILSWLVRGCLQWQMEGLNPPEIVLHTTEEQRESEDYLGDWLDECCIQEPGVETSSKELYDSFVEWYSENISSKNILKHRRFGQLMKKRFTRIKKQRYFYIGVRVRDALESRP